MSAKKVTLPKTFICASIKAFCNPIASIDSKSLRCEIALETASDPSMVIDTLSVTDRNANAIIPIIDLGDLFKLRLLDERGILSTVNYSVRDFAGFKGNCFAQWTNFQLKAQESKSSKQGVVSEHDPRIIKVLFEFIVDTAGNIKKFQDHRDKLVEISEKTSEVEETHENSTLGQEQTDFKITEGITNDLACKSKPDSRRQSRDEQTICSENSTVAQRKLSIQQISSNVSQNQLTQLEEKALDRSPSNRTPSPCKSKPHVEPSRASSISSRSNGNGLSYDETERNICQQLQTKARLDFSPDKTQSPDQRCLQLLNFNNQLISNIGNVEITKFFTEFLSQMNSFVEEFRKMKAENDHLKCRIQQLEEAGVGEKERSQYSRTSLFSTESKSSQLTPKSTDVTGNNCKDLVDKISFLERTIQEKENELMLLRDEKKTKNANTSVYSNHPLKKKASRTLRSDELVFKLQNENEKLKDVLLKENSNSALIKKELQKQYQKNNVKDQELKKINRKMKELEESVRTTTKAIVSMEFQRGRPNTGHKESDDSFNYDSSTTTQDQKIGSKKIADDTTDPQSEEDDHPQPLQQLAFTNKSVTPTKRQNELIKIQYSGDGMYEFGNKKIYVKKVNDSLFVKVGGGFVTFQDFLAMQKELSRNASESPFRSQSRSLTPKELTTSFFTPKASKGGSKINSATPKKIQPKSNAGGCRSSLSPFSSHTPNGKENQVSFSIPKKGYKAESLGKKSVSSNNVQEQAGQSLLGKTVVQSASKLAKPRFK